jgi:hypothetical protein
MALSLAMVQLMVEKCSSSVRTMRFAVYFRIEKLLLRVGKTGKKRLAHLFRHTRLTELAKTLTPNELALVAGWTDTKQELSY